MTHIIPKSAAFFECAARVTLKFLTPNTPSLLLPPRVPFLRQPFPKAVSCEEIAGCDTL